MLVILVAIFMSTTGEIEQYSFDKLNKNAGVQLFQGDILLGRGQLSLLSFPTNLLRIRERRQAVLKVVRWPGNIVNYYFDKSLDDRRRKSVEAAVSFLNTHTCAHFKYNPRARGKIRIFQGNGCYSTVGFEGGTQDLSLGRGCESVGIIIHELIHTLGVWHTQMRTDRDQYITMNPSAIPVDQVLNFNLMASGTMEMSTPYDYGSVMHYPINSFVKSGEISMIPRDERFKYTLGGRLISFYDLKMVNDHLGCSDHCDPLVASRCQNGGIPNPANCAVCNCPLGYGGPFCDRRPPGCGETLMAFSHWKLVEYQLGSNTVRDGFTYCNHWITAPSNALIQVKIVKMKNPQCTFGCVFNGMEVKLDANKQASNPRYCCLSQLNKELTSSLNPMPIISFNRAYTSTFAFQYRYVKVASKPPHKHLPIIKLSALSACYDDSEACGSWKKRGLCHIAPAKTKKKYCAKSCAMC